MEKGDEVTAVTSRRLGEHGCVKETFITRDKPARWQNLQALTCMRFALPGPPFA